jgi:UDP-galactopyranose mutase
MALASTDHWTPDAVVYDCMDELSAFKGAPAGLKEAEVDLLSRASLVLTGGRSLFNAKRHAHGNVHLFPSSVDVAHFQYARKAMADPSDQAPIAHPRLGFIGVIDERMDVNLLDELAAMRPDWQIVMIGPVVKIDPASLPRRHNLHYLGPKTYAELPKYLAGWDVALMPFARNESTRYISPTKTPEYLAAGKPVVSTAIADVVEPYGRLGLVWIADDVRAFVDACATALAETSPKRQAQADVFLQANSWDDTWSRIDTLMQDVIDSIIPTNAYDTAGLGRVEFLTNSAVNATSNVS